MHTPHTTHPPSLCLGRIDADSLRSVFFKYGYSGPESVSVASYVFTSDSDRLWLIEDLATGTLSVTSEIGTPLPDWLPRPALADILEPLSSDVPRDRLAGLQMAAGRTDGRLVEAMARLVHDPEPHVAEAALRWLVAYEGAAAAIDPIAAVFSLPGLRREKLQIMRWWMHDRPAQPDKLNAALARALGDPDWEIAATAMLAATTLGLSDLAPAFRKIALPDGPKDGVTRDEARLLLALRDAGLSRLGYGSADRVPPGVADVFDGKPDALPADLQHFASALSLPLPVGTPPPSTPGLIVTASGIAGPDDRPLAWVPPGAYRLGIAGAHRGARPNPPRIHHAERGFFIDIHPRGPSFHDDAQAEARRLSDASGLQVRLPDAEKWEMSVRGADGRRFPWGLAMHSRFDESPLGLVGLFEPTGEWIESNDKNTLLAAGGPNCLVPSLQRPAEKRECHAYRLTFMLK